MNYYNNTENNDTMVMNSQSYYDCMDIIIEPINKNTMGSQSFFSSRYPVVVKNQNVSFNRGPSKNYYAGETNANISIPPNKARGLCLRPYMIEANESKIEGNIDKLNSHSTNQKSCNDMVLQCTTQYLIGKHVKENENGADNRWYIRQQKQPKTN
jgi:hypothetical protein